MSEDRRRAERLLFEWVVQDRPPSAEELAWLRSLPASVLAAADADVECVLAADVELLEERRRRLLLALDVELALSPLVDSGELSAAINRAKARRAGGAT